MLSRISQRMAALDAPGTNAAATDWSMGLGWPLKLIKIPKTKSMTASSALTRTGLGHLTNLTVGSPGSIVGQQIPIGRPCPDEISRVLAWR